MTYNTHKRNTTSLFATDKRLVANRCMYRVYGLFTYRVNERQPLKVLSPIAVTLSGISTISNDVQPQKHCIVWYTHTVLFVTIVHIPVSPRGECARLVHLHSSTTTWVEMIWWGLISFPFQISFTIGFPTILYTSQTILYTSILTNPNNQIHLPNNPVHIHPNKT